MTITTALTRRLGFIHPIFQAPLAGGGDTPDLVAAVSNAGAVGFIGAAYLTGEQIAGVAAAVQAKTSRPFGINLFAPVRPSGSRRRPQAMLRRLAPYFAELGLPAPSLPKSTDASFDEQLVAALDSGASIFSFTFGILPAKAMAAIKNRSMFLIGTATTVEEAIELEKSGVDAVVAQGSEAGGHRATFKNDFASGMVGTVSLVPQVVDAVSVPVIASGGIMDGRGILAALALGSCAVQMGTAFLTCNEAGIPEAYKQAILSAHEDQTRITRVFSGRPARGIVNRFMSEIESNNGDKLVLSFPLQNALTRPLRTTAAAQGRAEFLSLWSGQGVRLARRQSASDLIARLVREIDSTLADMQSGVTSGA